MNQAFKTFECFLCKNQYITQMLVAYQLIFYFYYSHLSQTALDHPTYWKANLRSNNFATDGLWLILYVIFLEYLSFERPVMTMYMCWKIDSMGKFLPWVKSLSTPITGAKIQICCSTITNMQTELRYVHCTSLTWKEVKSKKRVFNE